MAVSQQTIEEHTVHLRVQVVDMHSFTLDLQVPNYLPARDLTQRVARDAGLFSHWPDGRRRLYWLRARGRLVQDHEALRDLGVVPGELVYLLPEPPAGSGVMEQPPDYPRNEGYSGKGLFALFTSILVVVAWSVGWGIALSEVRGPYVTILPGVGLGLLCTSVARHLWGGHGSRPRVVATGLLLFLAIASVAFAAPAVLSDESLATMYSESVPGFVAGLAGVLVAWLAWWGPVEPLPERKEAVAEAVQAVTTVPCAVCGGQVTPDVRQECPHRCGRYFHVGCYQARLSVYRGDPRICPICSQQVVGEASAELAARSWRK